MQINNKTKFQLAIEFVLPQEGGYSNDAADPGGETNFGISKRKYPNLDIKKLTDLDAVAIYRRDYWDRNFLDKFKLPFCVAVFDSYVQHRPSVVVEMLEFAQEDWKRLITARRDFYGRLIQKNPDLQKFLKGWTKRLNDLSKYLQEIEQTPMLS
jgi:lysozyme family protein